MNNNTKNTNLMDNKIYELMTSKVRELNVNIDNNLDAYLGEVANSRKIRNNIIDNIRKDALSINEFISNFNLNVKPHYIAEALSTNPDQDILELMACRTGNMLDDDAMLIPTHRVVRIDDEYVTAPDDMYFDDVNFQNDSSDDKDCDDIEPQEDDSDIDEEDLIMLPGKQTSLSDYLDEIDVSAVYDDIDRGKVDVLSEPDEPEEPEEKVLRKTRKPKRTRTYTIAISSSIEDDDDAKYTFQTTLYVTPKGELVNDNEMQLNIR